MMIERERGREGRGDGELQGNGCLPGSLIRGRHCLLSLSSLGIICLALFSLSHASPPRSFVERLFEHPKEFVLPTINN